VIGISRNMHWLQRLIALLETFDRMPFIWGLHDCGSAAADAVLAMTGQDLLRELRGPHRTALQAARHLRRIGGVPAALARAGLPVIAPAQAQRGDLLWLRQGRKQHVLAICTGDVAVAPGSLGLARAPISQAVSAWRV